jgi:predicted GNAT family acetyltransferase
VTAVSDPLDIDVRKDEPRRTYRAMVGGDLAGIVTYDRAGAGRIVLTHTAVLPEFQHRGVGSTLISRVLDDIRSSGEKATIVCPAVRDFIDHHLEYSDVVDPRQPGIEPSSAPG